MLERILVKYSPKHSFCESGQETDGKSCKDCDLHDVAVRYILRLKQDVKQRSTAVQACQREEKSLGEELSVPVFLCEVWVVFWFYRSLRAAYIVEYSEKKISLLILMRAVWTSVVDWQLCWLEPIYHSQFHQMSVIVLLCLPPHEQVNSHEHQQKSIRHFWESGGFLTSTPEWQH